MNIHKHMEAIFIVALIVVSAGTFAFDSLLATDGVRTASAARDGTTASARAVVVRAPTPAGRA